MFGFRGSAFMCLVSFLAVDPAFAGPNEGSKNSSNIRRNRFEINRGIEGYVENIGPVFSADLATWHSGMKVLDAGAGSALMLRQVAQTHRERGLTPPRLIAVGAVKPDSVSAEDLHGIDYHEGLLGTDGKLERQLGAGTFDRIIDSMGPIHYADQVDHMLRSYGSLLKPGGRLLLHTLDLPQNAPSTNRIGYNDSQGKTVTVEFPTERSFQTQINVGEKAIGLEGYVRFHAPGFKVVRMATSPRRFQGIMLERTRTYVHPKPVELDELVAHRPPKRIYRMPRAVGKRQ